MRPRHVPLALALLVIGCGGTPPAFAPLTTAAITPGVGVGTLTLGTTLDTATTRFGVDRASAFGGEEGYFMAELYYPDAGLALMFHMTGECYAAIPPSGRAAMTANALYRHEKFLAEYPACRSAPLVGIALIRDGDDAPFTGATPSGIRLGTTRDELIAAAGPASDITQIVIPGDSPATERYERVVYPEGLAVYLGPQDGEALWQVERIGIFDPDVIARPYGSDF